MAVELRVKEKSLKCINYFGYGGLKALIEDTFDVTRVRVEEWKQDSYYILEVMPWDHDPEWAERYGRERYAEILEKLAASGEDEQVWIYGEEYLILATELEHRGLLEAGDYLVKHSW